MSVRVHSTEQFGNLPHETVGRDHVGVWWRVNRAKEAPTLQIFGVDQDFPMSTATPPIEVFDLGWDK